MNETERDLQPATAGAFATPGTIPEPAAPPTDAPRPRRTPRGATVYDKLLESLANLAALGFAYVLWWIGAQFTLAFLGELGIPVDRLDLGKWLIPMAITAIEVKFWPHKTLKQQLLYLFLIVAGVDLLTSLIGGHAWLAGRRVAGLTVPAMGATPWIMSIVAALLCTFWPEKLARTAVAELRRIWF